MFRSKNSKYFFMKSEFCGIISQNWWFSKDLWSPIILRSLTKYMIYDHSRSWSAKLEKYDLRSLMIVIWSEMIGDHDPICLTLQLHTTQVCTFLYLPSTIIFHGSRNVIDSHYFESNFWNLELKNETFFLEFLAIDVHECLAL